MHKRRCQWIVTASAYITYVCHTATCTHDTIDTLPLTFSFCMLTIIALLNFELQKIKHEFNLWHAK